MPRGNASSRAPHNAHLLIEVLKSLRPLGVVEFRLHPTFWDWIVNRETVLSAGRQLRQRVNASAKVRGVVDIAILNDIVGVLQRRDVK